MSNTIALYVLCVLYKVNRILTRHQLPSFKLHIQVLHLVFPHSIRLVTGFSSTKEAQPEEDPSVSARLQRLQNNYEDFGMRRTVEGILVVHDHGHPHILMLQIANAFFKL